MSDFLNSGGDRRYTVEQWNALLRTNPAEHRAAHAQGRVDLPDHVRSSLSQSRTEARPIGFGDAEGAVEYQRDLRARETQTAAEVAEGRHREANKDASGEAFEQQNTQPAKDETTYTHDEWTRLSETDPAAAMAAHRENRVTYPEHIAQNLAANREPRIGG